MHDEDGEVATKPDAAPSPGWWDRPGAALAFMVLASLPVWFTHIPPLTDLPGHMARYRVELDLASSPLLQRNWGFEWAISGNLGVDLLIIPLSALLGLERAGWLVALLLPPLMVWGMYRVARAVHGRAPATIVAALPFATAYPFQYGFLNYWLSAALALHAFASWIRLENRPRLRASIFLPASLLIWLAHIYGWGILGLLVAGYELARRRVHRDLNWRGVAGALLRLWPLLLPLLPTLLWRAPDGHAQTLRWFDISGKAITLSWTLRDQWLPLDMLSLIAAALLLYGGWRHRDLRYDSRLAIPALLIALAALLMPFQLFGSNFADSRLFPIVFIVALLAVTGSGRGQQVIAAGAAALFAVRVIVGSLGFIAYDQAFTSHLRALSAVEDGSRIVVLANYPCGIWRERRIEHLGGMAVVRKQAFVNSQWDNAGALLLVPKGAPGTGFNANPSQLVGEEGTCGPDNRAALAKKIAEFPRDRFQYVWVLGFDPDSLPQYPGLAPLYADEGSVLFRVNGR